MNRRFRGKELHIRVENPERVEQGVKKITLNQKVIPGNFIPVEELLSVNEITVTMGK
jgi:N,N'-diacetylchitobiose phosphorylase